MKNIKNMLLTAFAIAAFSTSVSAGTLTVGLAGSVMTVDASGTETDTLTAGGAAVTDTSTRTKSISDDTSVGTIFAEYTFSDHAWPTTWGVEYTPGMANVGGKFSRTDTELSQTGNGTVTAISVIRTAEANATNFGTAYLEVPIWGMLYARAGVSNMTILHANSSKMNSNSKNIVGANFGGGLKGTTAGGLLWKLSYEETDYDGISLISTGNSVAANSNTVKADLDTSAYRISLGKSF